MQDCPIKTVTYESLDSELIKCSDFPDTDPVITTSLEQSHNNNNMEKTDFKALIERAVRCELLSAVEIRAVCEAVREVCVKEPNVVSISTPVTIAGDIHGQFFDLMQLFKTGGGTETTKYLFLGDYVDRGRHSVEVMTLLFLMKLEHPERITLLRGNHEARSQTQVFGFYDECQIKFGDPAVWRLFTDTFDFMPVAACVDGRLFCCHGGLSPSASSIDQIQSQERVKELSDAGVLADIAWSDPEEELEGWEESPRGAGYLFGRDVLEKWNRTNGLELLVRGHQMVEDGFFWHHNRQTLTLFSAPNYMYRCGNTAAVLEIQPNVKNLHFKQFLADNNESTDIIPLPQFSQYFV